jgi:hypothetical protein
LGFCYTSKGIPELTLLGIEEANATATKAELPLPDLSGVMQECWEKKLEITLEEVKRSAQLGYATLILSLIEKANEIAMNAGRSLPDLSGVMQECWEKKLDFAMEEVKRSAQLGCVISTLSLVGEANEAAMSAGLPLPDFSAAIHERRKKKLDLAIEK